MYPLSKDGICIALTYEENVSLGKTLELQPMADLLSFLKYTLQKQDYYQRRFLPGIKKEDTNWHIQERMYSWWLWWYHMSLCVQAAIDKKVNSLIVDRL